jgi:ABC-2 type transport system permease protein
MNKTWRVGLHEYTRHVLRRRFLFALLSMPIIIALMIGLILMVIFIESDPTPIGYMDQSGLLRNPVTAIPPKWPERTAPMVAFQDEDKAKAALQDGELQAYFVLSKDYPQDGQARLIFYKMPKGSSYTQFYNFLAANLLANQSEDVARRITEGNELIIKSVDGNREISQTHWMNILLPFFAGIIFIIAIATSSGYLMQAVVEEKENRTMEMIVTSVSPEQFMNGKIIADIAIGLTQILCWTIFIILVIFIGGNYIEGLQGISFSPDAAWLAVAVLVPAFIMVCALMAAVGSVVTESSEAQQMSGLFMMPIWIPFVLLQPIMENPNGTLAIILSFFPLTAPLTMILRSGFAIIPSWQIVTCIVILVLSAIGSLWLAGRTFRLGMLRYGKRLRWREIFNRKGA